MSDPRDRRRSPGTGTLGVDSSEPGQLDAFSRCFPTEEDRAEWRGFLQAHVAKKIRTRRDYDFYSDVVQEVEVRVREWLPRIVERSVFFGAIPRFVKMIELELLKERSRRRRRDTPLEEIEAPAAENAQEEADARATVERVLQTLPRSTQVRLRAYLLRIEAGDTRAQAKRGSAETMGISVRQMERHIEELFASLSAVFSIEG